MNIDIREKKKEMQNQFFFLLCS